MNKPTAKQLMNRKTDTSCRECGETIYTADEAAVVMVRTSRGATGVIVHRDDCEATFRSYMDCAD